MNEFKNATPIKKLIPEVAEENGISEKMLDDVLTFYYKKVNAEISLLRYPSIIILNFGRLRASKNKINFAIEKIKDFLKQPPSPSIHYAIKKKYYNNTRLLNLTKSLKDIEKKQSEHEGKYKERLEKQKTNSRRNKK